MKDEFTTPEILAGELEQLPLLALLAIAARCARRVQPLFVLPPNYPGRDSLLNAVNDAIAVCERIAVRFGVGDDVVAHAASEAAIRAGKVIESITEMGANAAFSAAHAALTAANITLAARSKDDIYAERAAYTGALAVKIAETAIRSQNIPESVSEFTDALRADIEGLKRLNPGNFPKLGLPVDAESEPLWQQGMPEWYSAKLEQMQVALEAANRC